MQSLNYAFRLIKANFSLAFKYSDLRKPWGRLWMGGFTLLILWLIPLGIVLAVCGFKPICLVLIGLFSVLLLFCLFLWGEVTALDVSRVFDAITRKNFSLYAPEEEVEEYAHWQEIAQWAMMRPGLSVIKVFNQLFRKSKVEDLAWLNGSHLVLPLIALENLTIACVRHRLTQIQQARLMSFNPKLIRLNVMTSLVKWALILLGGILGFWLGTTLADPLTAGVLSRLLALTCGLFVAGGLALLGILFSSFNRACYDTTLYQWAMHVELVRYSGDTAQNVAPEILSQAMRKTKNK